MEAEYTMEAELCGSEKELRDMFAVIKQYDVETGEYICFLFSTEQTNSSGRCVDVKTCDDISGNGPLSISGIPLFGQIGDLFECACFREMAEAAPRAYFYAEVAGASDYTRDWFKCELQDGLLTIHAFSSSNDEAEAAWFEEIKKELPFKEFKKLFKVSGPGFDDEVVYEDFLTVLDSNNGLLEQLEYDDFVMCVENYNGETKLTEEEYSALIKEVILPLGFLPRYEFAWSHEAGTTVDRVYDPVAKAYKSAD